MPPAKISRDILEPKGNNLWTLTVKFLQSTQKLYKPNSSLFGWLSLLRRLRSVCTCIQTPHPGASYCHRIQIANNNSRSTLHATAVETPL